MTDPKAGKATAEEQVDQVLDALAEVVVYHDTEMRIVWANAAATLFKMRNCSSVAMGPAAMRSVKVCPPGHSMMR